MIRKSSSIILSQNKLLVVKKKSNPSHYILPGGKIEKTETPLQALKRELNEELNLHTVDDMFEFVGVFYTKSQFENIQLETHLFYLKEKNFSEKVVVGNEINSFDWISLDDHQRNDLSSGLTEFAIREALKIRDKSNEENLLNNI